MAQAETDADIILWEGGNNDFPFFVPDLHIELIDPLRPGHETTHHPGEAVLRMADVILVANTNSASEANIRKVEETARSINPDAPVIRGEPPVTLDDPGRAHGCRVLVVEDGPTITHGGMPYGAGYLATIDAKAMEIIDPRDFAAGDLASIYRAYSHIVVYCQRLDTVPLRSKTCVGQSKPPVWISLFRQPHVIWRS